MAHSKVLLAEQIANEGVQLLAAHPNFEIINAPGLAREQLYTVIGDSAAVIVRSATRIDATVWQYARQLRVIGRAGIGVDNIDIDAATERGIVVLNTPDAYATTSAELALSNPFSLSRHLVQADRSVRAGQWQRARFPGSEIPVSPLLARQRGIELLEQKRRNGGDCLTSVQVTGRAGQRSLRAACVWSGHCWPRNSLGWCGSTTTLLKPA